MDFDEMKVIWDTQNERPLYAIDEAALHANIRRRSSRFERLVLISETTMLVVWSGLAVLYLIDPLLRGEEYHRLASAGIMVALVTGLVRDIARRRRGESQFEPSLRGDLSRAIWLVDNHIRWARALRRWYVLPFLAAISIDFAFRVTPQTVWTWLAVLAVVALATLGIEWEIRSLYVPKKERLEELRGKLVEAGQ